MFKEAENILENHHYLSTHQIAKLYDYPKNGQDDVFQAITQVVKSFIFFGEKMAEGVKGCVCYPLVVYSGINGVYLMPNNNTGDNYLDSLIKQKSALFNLKYSYPKTDFISSRTSYPTKDFYVDLIHKDELENFLMNIEKNEIEKIKLFWGDVKNRNKL